MYVIMTTDKSLRVRPNRWEAIEKKAWDFSVKEKKLIKPTDVADALLWKNLNDLTMEDVKEAMKDR